MKVIKQASIQDFERIAKAQQELNDSYSTLGVIPIYVETAGNIESERRIKQK